MKILVVVSEFPKLTETFVYRNVAEYKKLGHEVSIFHVKPFRSDEIMHDFVAQFASDAFTYDYVNAETISALLREAAGRPAAIAGLVGSILRTHRREPARGATALYVLPKAVALGRWCRANRIEHIHAEFAGFPATVAMVASRVSGAPFSFSAHANDIFVSQALLPEKARAARFVRSISDYNVRFLSALDGFPKDRLKVIRCGVERALLDADPPDPPAQGPLNVLYVGSLIEKKGVEHLLRAIAEIKAVVPVRCRIVGRGDLAASLERLAASLDLGGIVTFDGPKDADEVKAAYGWAHAVVAPSVVGAGGRVEGIPVVVMEALALARPVIASDLSGISELVEAGETGFLVPPGDPGAIAAALRNVFADWDAAARMGLKGRERIRAEYLVERNAAALASAMSEEATA